MRKKLEETLFNVGLFILFVVGVLLMLKWAVSSAGAQEAEGIPCPAAGWHETYLSLVGEALENRPQPADEVETLADKTITLYTIQFYLEAIEPIAPECAQTTIHKTALLIGLQADMGMLLVLQANETSGLRLPQPAFDMLLEEYQRHISGAEGVVQYSYQQLSIFEEAE